MGNDVDFFGSEGSASPQLVADLGQLRFRSKKLPVAEQQVEQPKLLARLIDAYSGSDIAFGLFGATVEKYRIRGQLWSHLQQLQSGAKNILSLQNERRDVDDLFDAASSLLPAHLSDERRRILATKLVDAIETLATWPLRPEDNMGGRPPHDEATQNLVNAIAAYCLKAGMPFSPARWQEETNTHRQRFTMTDAAYLTAAVLELFGVQLEQKTLATFMRRAKESVRKP